MHGRLYANIGQVFLCFPCLRRQVCTIFFHTEHTDRTENAQKTLC